jgi:hypothetical protein
MSQINYKSKYLKYKAKYLFIKNNQIDQEYRLSLNLLKGGAAGSEKEEQITINDFTSMIENRKNPIYTKIDAIQKEIDKNNIIKSYLESKLKEELELKSKLKEEQQKEDRIIVNINSKIVTTSYEDNPKYGKLKENTKLIDENTIKSNDDLNSLTVEIMQKTTDTDSGKYYYSYKESI